MRKLLSSIFALAVCMTGAAQSVGDAVYVYRNDGEFNAFLVSEVDSMAYSNLYLDGTVADDPVTQLIYTADSTYRIPLGSIDSISFVQPAPVLNKAVFPMTAAHSDYIVSADTLSFTMRGDTPSDMRPRSGDIVVASVDCEAFPDGIVARVVSVKKDNDVYAYTCEPSSFDEVFDQVVFCGEVGETESAGSKGFVEADPISFTKILWDKTFSGSLSYSGTSTTVSATDKTAMRVIINKANPLSPLEMTVELHNAFRSTIGFNAASESNIEPTPVQIGDTQTVGRIPIPIPYIPVNILWLEPELSLFAYFNEEGKVELNYSAHFNRNDVLTFRYRHGQWTYDYKPHADLGTDISKLSMEGSAEAGIIPKLYFSVNGTKAGFGANVQVGLKENVCFEIDDTKLTDGSFYSAMKDSYCRTTVPYSVSFFANANIFAKYDSRNKKAGHAVISKTFAKEPQWGEDKYLLPLFNDISSADNKSVSMQTSRDLLLPATIGVQLLDENKEVLDNQTSGSSMAEQDKKKYSFTFSDLEGGKTYYARPTVSIFGYTIPSNQTKELKPAATSCPDGNHPHMIDLGLPSGTKWACCNVGATTPEDYGNDYAWGETEQKAVYNRDTYTHYDSWKGWADLGSDIAGTEYDVAHVKWGALWHMPTQAQSQELFDNTTSTWTNKNGVNGREFTGSNGGTIFMPAGGYCWNDTRNENGDFGNYWSSALSPNNSIFAYFLNFDSDGNYWYEGNRSSGRLVRPVSE